MNKMGSQPMHSTPGRMQTDKYAVFVGGLGPNTMENDLIRAFQNEGIVVKATVIKDHHSTSNKGYGFVYFQDEHEVKCLLDKKPNILVNGRTVNISKARRRHPQVERSLNDSGLQSPTPKVSESTNVSSSFDMSSNMNFTDESGEASNIQNEKEVGFLYTSGPLFISYQQKPIIIDGKEYVIADLIGPPKYLNNINDVVNQISSQNFLPQGTQFIPSPSAQSQNPPQDFKSGMTGMNGNKGLEDISVIENPYNRYETIANMSNPISLFPGNGQMYDVKLKPN